jgi:hypothetical protein
MVKVRESLVVPQNWSFQQVVVQEGVSRSGAIPWLDLNHETGIMTVGHSADSLPDHEYTIPDVGIEYGFVVWRDGRVVEERMIQVKAGPRPVPNGPYAKYPADGPVELWRFIANSLDEPGRSIRFDAKNVSNTMRVRNLVGLIAVQEVTAPEFLSPIVRLYPPDSYKNPYDDKKKIYCVRLQPHDWMHRDGVTRQSSIAGLIEGDEEAPWGGAAARKQVKDPAELPWDTDDDNDDAA